MHVIVAVAILIIVILLVIVIINIINLIVIVIDIAHYLHSLLDAFFNCLHLLNVLIRFVRTLPEDITLFLCIVILENFY